MFSVTDDPATVATGCVTNALFCVHVVATPRQRNGHGLGKRCRFVTSGLDMSFYSSTTPPCILSTAYQDNCNGKGVILKRQLVFQTQNVCTFHCRWKLIVTFLDNFDLNYTQIRKNVLTPSINAHRTYDLNAILPARPHMHVVRLELWLDLNWNILVLAAHSHW